MSGGLKSPTMGPTTGPGAGKALGRVLVVAGSDPSGGAGIQADIKTITALGGYAAAAITALTVQNTLGVTDIMPVEADFVAAQMAAVLTDIGVDTVKIGMLHDGSIIQALIATLNSTGFGGTIVVDPVMIATTGGALLQPDALGILKEQLFPMATVVTPNIPEAEVLCGHSILCEEDIRKAGKAILALGPKAVLLKGGHLPSEDLVDTLMFQSGEEIQIKSSRIDTQHTHGTGCTLASAIATGLARGESLEFAFSHAHVFVRAAIENAPGFGRGNGPLGHAAVISGKGVF